MEAKERLGRKRANQRSSASRSLVLDCQPCDRFCPQIEVSCEERVYKICKFIPSVSETPSNPSLNPTESKLTTPPKMQPNLFLLAADNSPELIPLLRSNPASASNQDHYGYSLLHAAASYNHLDLLDALIEEFNVNVDLKDEDGETALFVTETIECAARLVETHRADITVRGLEGKLAWEKIAEENEFPQVAVYLRKVEIERQVNGATGDEPDLQLPPNATPPLPEGLTLDIGTMQPEDAGEVVDTEFKRRIDELAAREDFRGEEGQRLLRELVTEAIGGLPEERDVRPRHI